MLKRILYLILLSMLFLPNTGHAEELSLSLNQAWQLMRTYDPGLKAADELVAEQKGQKLSAISPFLPNVSANIDLRHYVNEEGFIWDAGAMGFGVVPFPATEKTTPRYSIGVEQLVFDSGKSYMQYKEASFGVQAAQNISFARRQNRALDLVQAYCSYYLADNKLAVAKAAYKALQEHLRVARLRYNQGLVQKTDLLSAEVAAQKAEVNVIEARDQLEVSAKRLASLIGQQPNAVSAPLLSSPPANIISANDRPEIKAKSAQVQAAKKEMLKETLSYLPKIYASFDAAYIDDDYRIHKDQYTVMGSLRWPLFDGAMHWGRRQAAQAKALRHRWEKQVLQDEYAVQLEDAKRMWARSDKEISVAKLNRSRANENLRTVKLNYRVGMVSALQVRDAVKVWQEASETYYQSICNKQLAAAKLRQAAGISIFEDKE